MSPGSSEGELARIEENRKNNQILEGLRDQIFRLRQKNAMAVSVPNISVAPSVVHFDDDTDELDNGGENGRRSARRKRRRVTLLNGHRHRSAPEDDYSSGDNDYLNEEALHILNSQLNAERMRRDTYEEMIHLLRDENDSALRANDALRRDLREMHNAMGEVKNMYERDLDRQRSENTRFKNQVQMQQRKLLSLWKAFCAVKREARELQTTASLGVERQKAEFVRCATMLLGHIKNLEDRNHHISSVIDRHKRESQEDTKKIVDELREREIIHEKEIIKRTHEVESLKEEVSRLKSEKSEMEKEIEDIALITRDTKDEDRFRTRSDAARKIRRKMAMQKSELDEAKETLRRRDIELERIKNNLENLEKQEKDRREKENKEIMEDKHRDLTIAALGRELKRAEERAKFLEEERNSRDEVIRHLEETIGNMQRSQKEFIDETMKRHRDELKERDDMRQREINSMTEEDKERRKKEQTERDRLNKEIEEARESLRNSKSEEVALRIKVEEKDRKVSHLEDEISRLKRELDMEKERRDESDKELEHSRNQIEQLESEYEDLQKQFVETSASVIAMQEENKLMQEQLTEARNESGTLEEEADQAKAAELELTEASITDLSCEKIDFQKLEISKSKVSELDAELKEVTKRKDELELDLEKFEDLNGRMFNDMTHLKNEFAKKEEERLNAIRELNDMKRDKELAVDEVRSMVVEIEAIKHQMEENQSKIKEKNDEKVQIEALLEDFRANFDRLTMESKQKDATAESLKEQITSLESELLRKAREISEDEEKRRLAERQKRDTEEKGETERRHKEELEKIRFEKIIEETETRLKTITEKHEILLESEAKWKSQVDELKLAVEKEREEKQRMISRIQEEVEEDNDKWAAKIKEEKDRYEAEEARLRAEIRKLIEEIGAKSDKESELRVLLEKAKAECDTMKMKLEEMERVEFEQKEALSRKEEANDEIVKRLRAELEASNNELLKIRMQNEELKRRIDNFDGELAQMKSIIEQSRPSLVRVFILETSIALRETKHTLEVMTRKAEDEEKRRKELENKLELVTHKLKIIEREYADKQAKAESSGGLIKKMEKDTGEIIEELNREKGKARKPRR
ncbi:hypothetical protein WR25_18620 [Diploscapter pachys]|uniref:Rootletin-like coiled-coil domain-containing protein n=1 Tax=Diploscapter pachys TaxID=2018661 RepID=A0A2A2LMP5_9BILA|nr:hypothetical protein WR25_18620 [Diploscapter pachys]